MDVPHEKQRELIRLLIPAGVLILVGLGLRWAFARQVPLFIDEAIGINWARDAANQYGNAFLGLHHARWLDSFIHSWFRPLGDEAVPLLRMVTSLLGMIPVAVGISLGRRIHSREAGWAAGALIALLPYTLWFDRQILGDPVAAAFAALMLWAMYGLAQERNPLLIMVGAFGLAGALLSKFQAAILIPVPLLTALIVARRRGVSPRRGFLKGNRWRALACALMVTALAGLIVLGVLIEADKYLEPYRSILRPAYYDWNWLRTPEAGSGEINLGAQWRETGGELWQAALTLWGPALLIALAAGLAALRQPGKIRRGLIWLWMAGPGTMLPFVLITTWLPARYLAVLSLPLALIAVIGISPTPSPGPSPVGFARQERGRPALRAGDNGWLAGGWRFAGVGLLLLISGGMGLSLLIAPGPGKLPAYDYAASYTDWTSGKGLDEVAATLRALDADAAGPSMVISGATVNGQLWGSYYTGGFIESYSDHPSQGIKLAGALLAGQRVYFLDSSEMPLAPYGIETEEIGRFEGAAADYRLRAATGDVSEELQTQYWSAVFGEVEPLRGDMELALNSIPILGSLALYPPHLVTILPEGSVAESQVTDWPPMQMGDDWPPRLNEDADEAIQMARDEALLTVILFNEEAGDPERSIETRLNAELVRAGGQYAGPLRVIQYAAPALDLQPQGAVYGELIELDAGAWELGDGFVVVELQWRALQTPPFGFNVAAHLVDAAGNIVAQHDGPPAGGLPPMSAWQPGQRVMDRFAFFSAGPACEGCSLRIIVYDPGSGARLALADGSEWWELRQARD